MKKNQTLSINFFSLNLKQLRIAFLSMSMLCTINIYAQQFLFEETVNNIDFSTEETQLQQSFNATSIRFANFNGITGTPDLVIKLSSDISHKVSYLRTETFTNGSEAWVGKIAGQPFSSVVFSKAKGVWYGRIQDENGKIFMVFSTDQQGVYSIIELGDSLMAEGDDQVLVSGGLKNNDATSRNMMSVCDAGSTCTDVVVDLLILYTDVVRLINGGTASVEAYIAGVVADLNLVNTNSGVTHSFNLKHTEEVNYAESGSSNTDLNRLAGTTDGFMDNAHTLRDGHGADLVGLLVEDGGGFCGLGQLPVSGSSENYVSTTAFTITQYGCAGGNRSFAHEVGHNMGLRHDRYVDDNNTPCAESHGYVNQAAFVASAPTEKRWRTVMAYNNDCADNGGFNCIRIGYWSNPSNTLTSDPMGVTASGSEANSTYVLNRAACLVSNYRTAPIENPVAGSITCAGDNPTFDVTITATGGSGNYNVYNSTSVFDGTTLVGSVTGAATTGTAVIPVTIPGPTITQGATLTVRQAAPAPSSNITFSVLLPNCNCTNSPATTELTEDFSFADFGGCCSGALPSGYSKSQNAGNGFLTGDQYSTGGELYKWDNTTDAWLFTKPVTLTEGVKYTFSLDYRKLFSTSTTETVTIKYGTAQSEASMVHTIGSATGFTTTYQPTSHDFTPTTSGVYHIGINATSSSTGAYTNFDKFLLEGSCICPDGNMIDDAATICTGTLASEISTWQTAVTTDANNMVSIASSVTGSAVVYSTVLIDGAVTMPNGNTANGVHSGGDNCASETQTTYAYLLCYGIDENVGGGDDSYLLLGTHTLTVNPDVQAPSENVNDCINTIAVACSGDTFTGVSTPTGGAAISKWNASTGVYTALDGDPAGTITIKIESGVSGSDCEKEFIITTPACGEQACPPTLDVTAVADGQVYQAANTLTSSIVIPSNNTVTFLAGQSITLGVGFEAAPTTGFTFTAAIANCAPPQTLQAPAVARNNNLAEQTDLSIYPNPARETVTIDYQLGAVSTASIGLYNLTGKKVTDILPMQSQAEGKYQQQLNLTNLQAGMYFVLLQTETEQISKKLILVR